VCYVDYNDENKCKETCNNPYHFEGNNSTKMCIEKTCSERIGIVNGSENKICGTEPCYLDPNNNYKCVVECRFPELYEPINGMCKLKRCTKRNASSLNIYPCGYSYDNDDNDENDDNENCMLDIDNKCNSKCSKSGHYENINGRCILKRCDLRKVNDSEENEYACGSSDCYEDINDKIENCEENSEENRDKHK
jgi:hypothetical protein